MSDNGTPPVASVQPKCPACDATLPHINWNTMGPIGLTAQGPPSIFVVFFCPECHVTLNCQLLPIPTMPTRPPVVIPGKNFR